MFVQMCRQPARYSSSRWCLEPVVMMPLMLKLLVYGILMVASSQLMRTLAKIMAFPLADGVRDDMNTGIVNDFSLGTAKDLMVSAGE